MELDFTALENINTAKIDFREPLGGEENNYPLQDLKALKSENRSPQTQEEKGRASVILGRDIEAVRKAQRAYTEYGENIRRSGELRAEILKGLKLGEPTALLLLKATECIARMTGDSTFNKQAGEYITTVYGAGLLEEPILEQELEAVRGRREKLEKALTREGHTQPEEERLKNAIKAHKEREHQLADLMKRS